MFFFKKCKFEKHQCLVKRGCGGAGEGPQNCNFPISPNVPPASVRKVHGSRHQEEPQGSRPSDLVLAEGPDSGKPCTGPRQRMQS